MDTKEAIKQKQYDLVPVAKSEGKLYALKTSLKMNMVSRCMCAADLSVADAVLDVFNFTMEQNLTIDVLINNAGFGDAGSFADCDRQKRYEMVQVNITALMQLTHCFLKGMIERGNGRILNLSSVASLYAGPDMSIYYASVEFRCLS